MAMAKWLAMINTLHIRSTGFILLICSSTFIFSQQNHKEDSILRLIEIETKDSLIAERYIYLSDLTTYNEPLKSLRYAQLSQEYAERANYHLTLARAYERQGIVLFHMGKKEESKQAFLNAFEVNRVADDYDLFGSVYYNISNIHYELGNYDSSLNYIEKAKSHFLHHNDSNGYAAVQYLSIGINTDMGNYYTALKNGLEAREIFRRNNNRAWEIYTLNLLSDVYVILERYNESIAMLYECIAYYRQSNNQKFEGVAERYLADVFLEMEKYDSAHKHINRSLELVVAQDFIPEQAKSLFSKGNILYREQKYSEALQVYGKGQELAKDVDDGGLQAMIHNGMGKCFYNLGELEASISSMFFVVNQAMAMGDRVLLRDAYQFLSKSYEQKGMATDALGHYKIYLGYYDTVSREEKNKQFAELSSKYEAEQKEKEISLLKLENEIAESNRRKTVVIFILALSGFALFLGLLWVVYRKNKQLLESQKEVVKVKNRFFANISHEFRTPLTLMLGPLYQILNDKRSSVFKEQLSLVQNNTKKLLKLVNQILDLSKIEAGKFEVNVTDGEFVNFFRKTVGSFESLAESKAVELRFNTEYERLHIRFDADITETILNNLLSNAIKHEPAGGKVNCSFTAKTLDGKDMLLISVHNFGSVIPALELERIFERFHQSKSNKSSDLNNKGTGIGLSFTKELVDLLGGNIRVESHEDLGTGFTVEIPYRNAEVSDAIMVDKAGMENGHENFEPSYTASPNGSSGHTVLVVDDNLDVLKFIMSCLEKDYILIKAENGEEGINKAFEYIPDLIISDVMMPIKDGLELSRTLKNHEATSHIPIILLTAKSSEENRVEGLKILVDDYLAKPFNPDELLTRVGNLIETRKRLRDHYSKQVNYTLGKIKVQSMEDAFLEKLSGIIDENIANENFSIEELSSRVGMSRSQLHRKLSALTDMSASQFVRNFRLNRAKVLLENRAGSVSEIAYMVGFTSPIYFNKCFKEYFKVTPGELRSQTSTVVKS